jgi:hypothetical protein
MNRLILAGAILLATTPAFAQSVPKLNYRATCESTPPVGMDKQATVASCLKDEEEARGQLPGWWAKSTRDSRSECLAETSDGGLPSYVELLTCLQGNIIETQK